MVSGVFWRRYYRVHLVTGYLCLAVALFHSTAAVICNIIEPLGALASAGMILTVASGYFKKKRLHIWTGVATLLTSIAHVVLIQILK